jgi:hypothetical protein
MEYNIIFCPTLFVGNKRWESEVQHLIPKVIWKRDIKVDIKIVLG